MINFSFVNIIKYNLEHFLKGTIIVSSIVLLSKCYDLNRDNDGLKNILDNYLWYNTAIAEIEDNEGDDDDLELDSGFKEEIANVLDVENLKDNVAVKECTAAEKKLFMNLSNRHEELLESEKLLLEKDNMLNALKDSISLELVKLNNLKTSVEKVLGEYKKEEDIHISGLVKVYENMKPKDASTIFNDLNTSVLLEVMNRMDREKLALILAKMDNDRARELTIELANYNRLVKLQ